MRTESFPPAEAACWARAVTDRSTGVLVGGTSQLVRAGPEEGRLVQTMPAMPGLLVSAQELSLTNARALEFPLPYLVGMATKRSVAFKIDPGASGSWKRKKASRVKFVVLVLVFTTNEGSAPKLSNALVPFWT